MIDPLGKAVIRALADTIPMTIEMQIRSEVYRAFEKLGADAALLTTIGSWGDTLQDNEVLKLLRSWNEHQDGLLS